MSAARGAGKFWTGTEWVPGALTSTQFLGDVTIGVIANGVTAQITYTDARFINPLVTGDFFFPIRAEWARTNDPTQVPILLRCVLFDPDVGQVLMQVHNQYAAPFDFDVRGVYFEILPPVPG